MAESEDKIRVWTQGIQRCQQRLLGEGQDQRNLVEEWLGARMRTLGSANSGKLTEGATGHTPNAKEEEESAQERGA